ncbi:tRNA pseudouridine(38-40) synthase TruA [uncultured Anaerococcus sp.]|uniref:tRNA pseudouridine(38-40) synthase TruA n=1 Tax=uncultured Anaerococcus sp. TaxID=293428 RepID=UPI00261A97F3|nr:tRNA pseudouridine(38-40) synthase TruA [uncultured Anaerococcus sp.]
MVKNILLKIAYDGTNFHGYQYQEGLRSVENEVKRAINKVTGEDNRIIAAGRTDAGVHAYAQYINFLTATNINPKAFKYHLDPFLPDDILALESSEVDLSFHARFSAKSKTYKYIINRTRLMHPIYRNYMEEVSYPLDLEQLARGLEILKGEHDFKAFMRADKDLKINTIRKIDDCYYEEDDSKLIIYFKANSFLHNQVRIMVGSLVELARGRLSISDFESYFDIENDKRANPALSPSGLYLWSIDYE